MVKIYRNYVFLEKKYQEYIIHWMKETKIQNARLIYSLDHELIIQNIDALDWDYTILSIHLPPAFIFEHLDKPWSWDAMSANKRLTWDDYLKHKDKPWNTQKLMSNTHIDVHTLIQSEHVDWKIISARRDIPLDVLEKYIHVKDRWSWMSLSMNSSIPISFILQYPTGKWDWRLVTCRATPEDIIHYKSIPWDYSHLSMHHNTIQFPFQYIYKNPDRPWNYAYLSQRNDVDMRMVIEYPDRGWNWYALTKYVHFDQIVKYPSLDWKRNMLCKNMTLTKEHIQATPQFNWKPNTLKKPMTVQTLASKPKDWEWEYVLCNWENNPNIMEMIQSYPEKNWYWRRISASSYITLKFIEQYKDKQWDWDIITVRKFKYSKDEWIREYRLRHITAMRLQRYYRTFFCDLKYKCARNAVLHDYEK